MNKQYREYKEKRKKAGCRKVLCYREWLEMKDAKGLIL